MRAMRSSGYVLSLVLGTLCFADTAGAYELMAEAKAFTAGGNTNSYIKDDSQWYPPTARSTTVALFETAFSSAVSPLVGGATAYADLGVLKVSSLANASASSSDVNLPTVAQARGYAYAEWTDTISFLATGYSGDAVAHVRVLADIPANDFLHVSNNETYSIRMSATGQAISGLWVDDGNSVGLADTKYLYTQAFERYDGYVNSRTNTLLTDDPGGIPVPVASVGGYYDVDIPVILGGSTGIRMAVQASSDATGTAYSGSFSLNSSVDMSHSVYWDGITSLTLLDGTVITDFTALGSGGHDWRLSSVPAVPEPETYAMLLAGLGLIGILTRRRAGRIQRVRT